MGVLEVIERCSGPTVRANDALVLVFSDPVLDSLNRHSLAGQYLDLEVGALVFQLLI